MSRSLDAALALALAAVREAAVAARTVQRHMAHPSLTKRDASPVTIADFACQALVARRLAQAFPDDILVAEESSAALRAASARDTLRAVHAVVRQLVPDAAPEDTIAWIDRGGGAPGLRYWTLDPIDGTKGFLRGGQYAVALALVEDGRPTIGVIGCPSLVDGHVEDAAGPGSLAYASKGGGAWIAGLVGDGEPSRLAVSDCRATDRARLVRSFEPAHTDFARTNAVAAVLRLTAVRDLDSLAKWVIVASGHAEILVRFPPGDRPGYRGLVWDHAAGAVLVAEAGGRVTDLCGEALDFATGRTLARNTGVVATNGLVHDAVLLALREGRSRPRHS